MQAGDHSVDGVRGETKPKCSTNISEACVARVSEEEEEEEEEDRCRVGEGGSKAETGMMGGEGMACRVVVS